MSKARLISLLLFAALLATTLGRFKPIGSGWVFW
jgi:hypothetical protein